MVVEGIDEFLPDRRQELTPGGDGRVVYTSCLRVKDRSNGNSFQEAFCG